VCVAADRHQQHPAARSQRAGMCCSVLQCVAVCVAVCCSVLQCVAVYCSVLQCIAVCCIVCCSRQASTTSSYTLATRRYVLHCVALCCSVCCSRSAPTTSGSQLAGVLQCVSACGSVLHCVALFVAADHRQNIRLHTGKDGSFVFLSQLPTKFFTHTHTCTHTLSHTCTCMYRNIRNMLQSPSCTHTLSHIRTHTHIYICMYGNMLHVLQSHFKKKKSLLGGEDS